MILDCYTCGTNIKIDEELKPIAGEQSFNFICVACGWLNKVRIMISSVHSSSESIPNEST